jgi:hypothetical protein
MIDEDKLKEILKDEGYVFEYGKGEGSIRVFRPDGATLDVSDDNLESAVPTWDYSRLVEAADIPDDEYVDASRMQALEDDILGNPRRHVKTQLRKIGNQRLKPPKIRIL